MPSDRSAVTECFRHERRALADERGRCVPRGIRPPLAPGALRARDANRGSGSCGGHAGRPTPRRGRAGDGREAPTVARRDEPEASAGDPRSALERRDAGDRADGAAFLQAASRARRAAPLYVAVVALPCHTLVRPRPGDPVEGGALRRPEDVRARRVRRRRCAAARQRARALAEASHRRPGRRGPRARMRGRRRRDGRRRGGVRYELASRGRAVLLLEEGDFTGAARSRRGRRTRSRSSIAIKG